MIKHGLLISALRRLWLQSKERYQAIKNARISRGVYQCQMCRELFKMKQLQVNHKIPLGRFVDWNTFVQRLFCEADGLEAICKECHKKITAEQRKK